MALGVATGGVRRIVQQSQPSVLHRWADWFRGWQFLPGLLLVGRAVAVGAAAWPSGIPRARTCFGPGSWGFRWLRLAAPRVCTEVCLSATYLDLFVTLLALSPFLTKCKRQLRGEMER